MIDMLYFDLEADWQKFKKIREEITNLETQLNDITVERSEKETKRLEGRLESLRVVMERMTKSAALAGNDLETGFQRSITASEHLVQDFNARIIESRKRLNEYISEQKQYYSMAKNATNTGVKSKLTAKGDNMSPLIEEERQNLERLRTERDKLNITLQRNRTEYEQLRQEQEKQAQTSKSVVAGIAKLTATLGGAAAIKSFAQRMVQTRASFQQMEAALETMVGSNKAGELMTELKDIAKQSPLTMQSMVSAEKTMLGFGLSANKTTTYIKALSDVSMGDTGKFNALTLAFSQMSAAGRLMGQDLLQMINAGFNPLEQMSRTTGKSIAQLKEEMSKGAISAEMVQKAFLDATQAGGKFAGMSEATAKTINGQMSMLNDALDNMFNELGKSAEGFVVSGISKVTELVQSYDELVPAIEAAVASLGAIKVASLVNIKIQEQSAMAARFYGKAITDVTMREKLKIGTTNALKNAQLALNAAMKAAPWALAAAAIGAVVYAAIKYHEKQKEIHASETRLGEAMAKTAEKTEKEQTQFKVLTGELENLTEGTDEYNKKKKEVIDYAAQYDSKLAKEISEVGNLNGAYEKLAKAIEEANNKRMALDFYSNEKNLMSQRNAEFISEQQKLAKERYVDKGDSVEAKANRAVDVNNLFNEIQKGLENNTLKMATRLVETGGYDQFGNAITYVETYFEGLSERADETLKKMSNGWNGGARLKNALSDLIEQNEVTFKTTELMFEKTNLNYEKLAQGYVSRVDTIVSEAQDATKNIQKNWEKKAVEGLKDKATNAQTELNGILENLNQLKEDALKAGDEKQATNIQTTINNLTNDQLKSVSGYVSLINSQIDNINNEKLPAAVKRAKKEWQDAEKAFLTTKNNPNASKKQYDEAKTKLDTAKKNYQAVGGKPIDYEQRIENERKANEEIEQMKIEHEKRMLDLTEDGFDKQLKKLEEKYDDQIRAVEKKEKELTKKVKEGKITQSQAEQMRTQYQTERTDAKDAYTKETQKLTQSLIDEYNEFDKRRREIDDKWNKDKEALSLIVNDQTGMYSEQQKDKANIALTNGQQRHDKQILDVEMDALQTDNQWKMVMDNLQNYGVTTLTQLKQKLDEIGGSIKANLNPADLQAFNSAMDALQARLMDFQPKDALDNARKDLDDKKKILQQAQQEEILARGTERHAETLKKLRQAEDDAARAQEQYNVAAGKFKEYVQKMSAPLGELSNQMQNLSGQVGGLAGEILDTASTIISSTMSMITSIVDLTTSTTKTIEGTSKVASAAISAVEKASVILAIISAVIQIAQKIDEMLDKKSAEAEEKRAQIAKLQSAVNQYKMSVLEAQQAEKSWFNNSGFDNLQNGFEKGQQALKNYYETANRMEDKYVNKKGGGFFQKLGEWGSKLAALPGELTNKAFDAIGLDKVGDVMAWVATPIAKGADKLIQKVNDGGQTGDNGFIGGLQELQKQKEEASKQVRAIDNLRIETRSAKKGFLGIGSRNQKTENLQDWLKKQKGFEDLELFDENEMINLEAANAVLDNFGDKLVGNTKETIEQLKEAREQYDEYVEQLHSYVSDLFGGITDSMVDALFNWLDTGEDVMDTFEQSAKDTFRNVAKDMTKMLINKMVMKDYSDNIAKQYEKFNAGEISAEQLTRAIGDESAELKARYESALPVLKEAVEGMNQIMDFKATNDEQQSAVAGGFQTMSEDTAGVLEARFTAVYESNLAIQGGISEMNQSMTRMTGYVSNMYSIANDTRNILANSYLEQWAMREATERIEGICKRLDSNLEDVKTNTNRI